MAMLAFGLIGSALLFNSFASTLQGDLDGNNIVDGKDLNLMISRWDKDRANNDLNGDGRVTAKDLVILLNNWTKSQPKPTSPIPVPAPAPIAAPAPAAPRVIKIMPLGSSTVEGTGSSNGAGFRYPLYKALVGIDKRSVDFVGSKVNGPSDYDRNHEGHSGWNIGTTGATDLNTYVSGWMNTYKPDIVLFYAGTNDLGNGASAADTAARFDALSAKVFAASPNVKLIAATLMHPIDNATVATKARDFNSRMGPIAQKYRNQGRYMQIVDFDGIITNADHYDGLHANDSGYAKQAAALLTAIRATYPSF